MTKVYRERRGIRGGIARSQTTADKLRSMRKLALLAVAALACAHQPQRHPVVVRPAPQRTYAVIMAGARAGQQVVLVNGVDRIIDFEYNDRGRGPKTHTLSTLDPAGVPVALHTTGVDYFKVPVDERLTIANGRAHWENGSETSDGGSGRFYASMYGPPEEIGMIAAAALKAGGHVGLLPSGEVDVKRGGDLDLDANGRRAHVTRYEMTGLGFSPAEVWLDDQNQFFATASSWMSVVRDGFEGAIPRLIEAQDVAGRKRSAAVAKTLTHRPASIAITNARLFDPVSLRVTPNTTIVIRGNRIEAVGADVAIPADAERIDAAGKTVIPGLWDMHVHLSEEDGLLNIAAGITSVRDLGNDLDYALALQKQFGDGSAIGPRVILAGLVDGPGPFAGPTKFLIDNEEQARKAIDTFASHGYVQTKIYSSIKPELVPFIARYSHEKGMRVSGHVPAHMTAADAVRAGYDEIQHANMLLLNFMPDVKDTRTPARFTAVAERAANLDLASPEVRGFIELLLQHKTVVDPTVTVFEGMFVSRRGAMSPSYAAIADRLPAQVRRSFLTGGLAVREGMDDRYRASFAKMMQLVKMLYDDGVPIVAGTDGLAGFTLHRELELYVQAGIPAPEVLRIATLGGAKVMHRDSELGSVAPGKLADLVVIDGDPTTNISDVRKPVWVVKDGLLFSSRAVYQALGVR
jgi:hypothetical protein